MWFNLDHLPKYTSKFNISPLKNDGTGKLLSFWEALFSGAMLNFRGVNANQKNKLNTPKAP